MAESALFRKEKQGLVTARWLSMGKELNGPLIA